MFEFMLRFKHTKNKFRSMFITIDDGCHLVLLLVAKKSLCVKLGQTSLTYFPRLQQQTNHLK